MVVGWSVIGYQLSICCSRKLTTDYRQPKFTKTLNQKYATFASAPKQWGKNYRFMAAILMKKFS